jgi:hypothetical protein
MGYFDAAPIQKVAAGLLRSDCWVEIASALRCVAVGHRLPEVDSANQRQDDFEPYAVL